MSCATSARSKRTSTCPIMVKPRPKSWRFSTSATCLRLASLFACFSVIFSSSLSDNYIVSELGYCVKVYTQSPQLEVFTHTVFPNTTAPKQFFRFAAIFERALFAATRATMLFTVIKELTLSLAHPLTHLNSFLSQWLHLTLVAAWCQLEFQDFFVSTESSQSRSIFSDPGVMVKSCALAESAR